MKTVKATKRQVTKICFQGRGYAYDSWRWDYNHGQCQGRGAYCDTHDTSVHPLGHGRWRIVTRRADGVTGEAETARDLVAA